MTLTNENLIQSLCNQAGLEKKTVYGIVNKAKKQKRLRSPKRGTYVVA